MPYAEKPPVLARASQTTRDELAATGLAVPGPMDAVLSESPPEHTWIGMAFVWMMYGAAAGGVIVALDSASSSDGAADIVFNTSIRLVASAVGLWLAWAIQTFRLQGYGVAMLMLVTTLFGAAANFLEADSLLDAALAGGLFALVGTWVRYFLMRFSDFS